MTSILVVDDNPEFLSATVHFLKDNQDILVIGAAGGGREGLTKAQILCPDVVLMDLDMPDLPGLEAIALLRKRFPHLGIIALTFSGSACNRRARAAGADDFIPKAAMITHLVPAIRQVAQSRRFEQITVETSRQEGLSH